MIRKRRHALLVPLLLPLAMQSRWACLAFSTSTQASQHPIAKSANQDPIRLETKSCSPPRFDVFGESLVGKWAIDGGTTPGRVRVASVEEVMRSCGGAVQGIREPAGTKEVDDDEDESSSSSSTYLNRANDGFVFFDDGSYTMGPISLQTKEANKFLSCLVLSEKDFEGRTQRMVMDFGLASAAEDKDQLDNSSSVQHTTAASTATMRTKQRFGDEIAVSSGMGKNDRDNTVIEMEEITRIMRCRMPSEGQPWMLQRAKWETLVPSTKDDEQQTIAVESDSDEDDASSKEQNNDSIWWAMSEPTLEFFERLGLPMADEGTMIHSGVGCPKTNTLRLLARQYQSSNNGGDNLTLCGILLIEGRVKFR